MWHEKEKRSWVGILIKCDKDITIDGSDYEDPRIIAFNMKIYGFNIRMVNVYAPTESGGRVTQKDAFYRSLNKACTKTEKHQR